MGMMNAIRVRVNEIRNRLTHIGKSEPLSIVSLIFIGLLDIFVFSTIQSGTYAQVEQLTSPDEYIPYVCRSVVIEDLWVEDNYVEKVASYSLSQRYSWRYLKQQTGLHPVCQEIIDALAATAADNKLTELFKERQKLEQKYGAYDLYQKQTFPEARKIQLTLREVDQKIAGYDEVRAAWSTIEANRSNATQLAEDHRHAIFVYPLERFAMQMMFLLPLFLIFYAWNAASIRRDRPVQALLSAHMLVVAFIPIMFRMGELLIDIIPKRFLARLMELLESLNLIGLWSYLIIAISITVTILIIFVIQKKLFTKEKLIIKRLTKGQCIECGLKMPTGSACCPYCGCDQTVQCSHCQQLTAKGAPFCSACGNRIS